MDPNVANSIAWENLTEDEIKQVAARYKLLNEMWWKLGTALYSMWCQEHKCYVFLSCQVSKIDFLVNVLWAWQASYLWQARGKDAN